MFLGENSIEKGRQQVGDLVARSRQDVMNIGVVTLAETASRCYEPAQSSQSAPMVSGDISPVEVAVTQGPSDYALAA